jgi:hypothetical protein
LRKAACPSKGSASKSNDWRDAIFEILHGVRDGSISSKGYDIVDDMFMLLENECKAFAWRMIFLHSMKCFSISEVVFDLRC